MAQVSSNETPFVVDLLTTLRQEKFSPAACVRFLARSWKMSRRTAYEYPTLKRSWLRVSAGIGALALALLVGNFALQGAFSTLRLLPGFLFCAVWQINDLFWHLGLNRNARDDIYSTIGLATMLTQVRGVVASFLLGRLVGGLATPVWLALVCFLVGILTDILDGQVAQRAHTQSKLGQLLDGETDFFLYLALTFILLQNGILPLWVAIVMVARFLVPLLAALASYFLLARRVQFGSTRWGKLAGLAQCLYFGLLLAPAQFAIITNPLNVPLLVVTLGLLISAPVAQIVGNIKARGKV